MFFIIKKIGSVLVACLMIGMPYLVYANGYLSDNMPANRVLYLLSHNAHCSSALGWRYYQQQLDYKGQWNSGARGGKIILQWRLSESKFIPNATTQYFRTASEKLLGSAKPKPFIALCHESPGNNNCSLTVTAELNTTKFNVDPAINYFAAMALLLRENPRDTVVIILEDYLTSTSEKNGAQGYTIDDIVKQLDKILTISGLAQYALKLTPEHYGTNDIQAKDWPTLGEMRKTGKRAIIFINDATLSAKSPYLNNEGGMFKRSEYAFDWKAEERKKDPIKEKATPQEINDMCELIDSNPLAVALRVDIGPESSIPDRSTIGLVLTVAQKIDFINRKMADAHTEVANYRKINSQNAIEKRLNQCQERAQGTWPTIMMTDFVDIGNLQSTITNINKQREKLLQGIK